LRPSVSGFSDAIRVTSIVGRFLEHSRVYYFRNGGSEEIYLGSADLMRRNLSNRVEILFPVANVKLVHRLKDILALQLADERKSHHLRSDGHYARSSKSAQPDAIDSQLMFLTNEQAPLTIGKGLAAMSRKRRVAARPLTRSKA
jgi:polyphosphate kinase